MENEEKAMDQGEKRKRKIKAIYAMRKKDEASGLMSLFPLVCIGRTSQDK